MIHRLTSIKKILFLALTSGFIMAGCNNPPSEGNKKYDLVVLDPGHFHAALVQKTDNDQLDPKVRVFAPDGPDVTAYLDLINQYNDRRDDPTHWNEEVYKGTDYFEKMLSEIKGGQNIVVLAGNNQLKMDYISKSIQNGLNVFADKPMVINAAEFDKLIDSYKTADDKKVLLYDIMTERYEITNILQKEFMGLSKVFGELLKGTEDDPAVYSESVHNLHKEVSGNPLIRPTWFFDVRQQGDGLTDVMTHIVDLFIWQCFPNDNLDYTKDVQITKASLWPTVLSLQQFTTITNEKEFPGFLQPYIKDGQLNLNANGEINMNIKGVYAKERALWDYEAPSGGIDTYYSVIKGSKADIIIRQGKEQNYRPTLYLHPKDTDENWVNDLNEGINELGKTYPGIGSEKEGGDYKIIIPADLITTHEQHFAMVLEKYLGFLNQKELPRWEKSTLLTKYFITTDALKKASGE